MSNCTTKRKDCPATLEAEMWQTFAKAEGHLSKNRLYIIGILVLVIIFLGASLLRIESLSRDNRHKCKIIATEMDAEYKYDSKAGCLIKTMDFGFVPLQNLSFTIDGYDTDYE